MATSITAVSDAQLVARCRTGERAAWDELVNRFARYVTAIATRGYRLAPADAEEVFQDVFARVFERLDSLRDDDALRPWIGQLTRRMCVDRLRVRDREQAVEEVEPAGVDDTLATLDEAMAVHQALERLPQPCREILDSFFTRDESYATIGARLDIPPGTVASRISRCLGRLREAMGR